MEQEVAALAPQIEQSTGRSPRLNAALVLDNLLVITLQQLQPTEQDLVARADILHRLQVLIGEIDICRGLVVRPFGSFLSNLYTPWGDLDISLVMPVGSPPLSRTRKLKILKSIQNALLRAGGAIHVQVLVRPRVPLLMFEDDFWRISCDISVSNTAAIFKSHVLGLITCIDPRCRQLIFLVKCWAKAQCINDPKLGTLNSYALSLLVIFHLQTRHPPILPPLNAMFTQDDILHAAVDGSQCFNKIKELTATRFGRLNTSSIGELFISFFHQFAAVEELWLQGLAVCTFSGKWGDKMTTDPTWESKGYVMRVEDPFDLSDNCARSVHQSSFQHICKAFSLTRDVLSDKFSYWIPPKLKETLFRWPHESPRPFSHSSKPGIEKLGEFVTRLLKTESLKKAWNDKRGVVYRMKEKCQGEEVAQPLANEDVTSCDEARRKPKPRLERRDRRREDDPESELLSSIRKLFVTPKWSRRQRNRGIDPKQMEQAQAPLTS